MVQTSDVDIDTATPPRVRQSGAEALVSHLERAGVRYVFGMSGHANLAILDALAHSTIKFISFPHEQLAVHAADCYFRASHRLGVVLTTLGPGITNTVSALADAIQDCSAVMVLAGNVPQSHAGREAYQEVSAHFAASQVEVLRPVIKRAWRVTDSAQLLPALANAYNWALSAPSGPVVIDLPMDVMSATDEYAQTDLERRRTHIGAAPNPDGVRQAAELLLSAHRPLVFCGGGVLLAGANEELRALAERLRAPVVTTLMAQGVMDNCHDLYGGVSGSVGTPTAHFLAANADVVLAVGTRLSDMDANSLHPDFSFSPREVRLVQIDTDATQIGKVREVNVGLVADAKVALTALLDAVGRGDAVERSEWLEAFDTQRAVWRAEIGRAQTATDVPLTTESVLHDARGALPANTSVVAGIGPRYLIAQHFPVSQPGTHFAASGSGTMGFAVPGALGVKLARPNDPVVCICGDGEVKSTSQAIATAVEYQIPVIWIILNNYSYNVIELYQNRYYGTLNGSVFTTPDGALYSPDYCRLAEAYGALGEHVRKPGELTAALGRALQADRPYLIEVEVSRRPKLRASGFWEANRYLRRGWNLEARDEVIGGFGDAGTPQPWRRRWDK